MESLLKTLATHMRERRKSLGITQEQLADRADLSVNYVGKMELGQRVPSFKTLVRLAGALEVEVCELLGVFGERPRRAATNEIERVMEQFDDQDAAFMLSEFQHIAGYVRSIRKRRSR